MEKPTIPGEVTPFRSVPRYVRTRMGICGLKTSAFVWTLSTNVVVDQEKYTAVRAGHVFETAPLRHSN